MNETPAVKGGSNDGEESVLVNAEQLGEGFGVSREESNQGEAELPSVFHAGGGVVNEVCEKERKEGFLQLVEGVAPLLRGGRVTGRFALQVMFLSNWHKRGKQRLPLSKPVVVLLGQGEQDGRKDSVHVTNGIEHAAGEEEFDVPLLVPQLRESLHKKIGHVVHRSFHFVGTVLHDL